VEASEQGEGERRLENKVRGSEASEQGEGEQRLQNKVRGSGSLRTR